MSYYHFCHSYKALSFETETCATTFVVGTNNDFAPTVFLFLEVGTPATYYNF